MLSAIVHSEDRIPTGFKAERYARVWERNPFTLVKAVAPEKEPSAFDKLFLASWLKDADKEVIFVQNSETNEVQRITPESNQNNLRLIQIYPDPNPRFVTAVISDGKEQGPVKFRLDAEPVPEETGSGLAQMPKNGATGQAPNPTKVNARILPSSSANLPNPQVSSLSVNPPVTQALPSRFHPGIPRVHTEGGSAQAPLHAVARDAKDGM